MSQAAVAVHNVFVYGSLLSDDVVRVLLNRVPPSSAALLNGFRRFSIKGRLYPAILPVENHHVTGRVLLGITGPELYILDEFEDFEYYKAGVDVSLLWLRTLLPRGRDPYGCFGVGGGWKRWEKVVPRTIRLLAPQESSDKLQAHTYVWSNPSDPKLYGDWDFEEWQKAHKESFVKMTMEFMEELELPESKPRVATYESFYQQDAEK